MDSSAPNCSESAGSFSRYRDSGGCPALSRQDLRESTYFSAFKEYRGKMGFFPFKCAYPTLRDTDDSWFRASHPWWNEMGRLVGPTKHSAGHFARWHCGRLVQMPVVQQKRTPR